MKPKSSDLITQNKVFAFLAVGTGVILLIPLIMAQISISWDWDFFDFIVMGVLLFGMGSIFILAARKVQKKNRLILGIIVLSATLYAWAELAVGIFTNLGS